MSDDAKERCLPCRCDECDSCGGSGGGKAEGGSCGCPEICHCPEECPDCDGAGRLRSRAPACDIAEHRDLAWKLKSAERQIKDLQASVEALRSARADLPAQVELRGLRDEVLRLKARASDADLRARRAEAEAQRLRDELSRRLPLPKPSPPAVPVDPSARFRNLELE